MPKVRQCLHKEDESGETHAQAQQSVPLNLPFNWLKDLFYVEFKKLEMLAFDLTLYLSSQNKPDLK